MATMIRRPTPPGEILEKDFMELLGLTQQQVADGAGISRRRVNEIIRGRREITPDTAMRLGKLFGVSPELWLNLQQAYTLWELRQDTELRAEYRRIRKVAGG